MLYLYFCGLCMGAADLIPGISGGTIAFIMGFYATLLESLKSINRQSLKLLAVGQFTQFFQAISWRFLLPLGLGITTSFICFTEIIHAILSHDLYRTYLYALFTGLIIGSTLFCIRQIHRWTLSSIFFMLCGFGIAWTFTGTLSPSTELYKPLLFIDPWLIFCGILAISAMLLPGVSGSYLLTLFGVYPSVIKALTHFLRAIRQGVFDLDSFSILLSLFIGIIIGLLSFARVVSWLLKNYSNYTLSLLTGFMIGGMRSVWPFSLAEGSEHNLYLAIFSLGGFMVVLLVEGIAYVRTVKELG